MNFINQIKPFEGLKVKWITNIKRIGKDKTVKVAIIFNDKFGSALFFTKNGKFKGVGATKEYGF